MSKIKMIGLLDIKGNETVRRVYDPSGISPTLTTSAGGNRQPKVLTDGGNGLKTLKTNDLFCGAGGMGLGFKQAGFDIAGAWDFDKFAVQSYKHNVGDHVLQADITEMTWKDMPKANCWTFGFPCQDLSIAGNQAGMKLECKECNHEFNIGGEDGFVPTYEQIMKFGNKKFCPECESLDVGAASRSGLFFEVMRLLDETIENDMERLPETIMAENVKGLRPYLEVLEEEYKQRGYKMYYKLYNSKFWGVPQNRDRFFVIGVHESIEKEFEFPIQQDKYIPRLSTILETEVDEKYYIDPEKTKGIIEKVGDKLRIQEATKKGYAEAGVGDTLNISHPKSKTRRGRKGDQVAQTLLTGQEQVVVEPAFRVRKLTAREYARLQSFPEEFEIVVSNSQAYKQFGNAVTVNVAKAIAERLKMFLLSL